MHDFEKRVFASIRHRGLVQRGDRVLVAFSGGADSVALVLALQVLSRRLDTTLRAAHLNHRLRAEESEGDEVFVRSLCRRQHIPLTVGSLRSKPERAQWPNLEARLRRLRYRFLVRTARRSNSIIATAHHLNDQAETFFLKLLRGAGPAGLSGIYPLRKISVDGQQVRVIRPLIDVTRTEILRYLEEKGETFREDRSNQDLQRDRNWLRHTLIPLLEKRFHPGVVRTMGRNADLSRKVTLYLQKQARKALGECRAEAGKNSLSLDLNRLADSPQVLQGEIIRRAIRDFHGSLRGFTRRHVEDITGLIRGQSGREISLPGGLTATREYDRLLLIHPEVSADFEKEVSIPGEIFVKEIGRLIAIRKSGVEQQRASDLTLSFGGDRMRVRNRRPGDRFYRLTGTSRKLKTLFQEKRIPRSVRPFLMILEWEGKILWVEGLGPHPDHRVTPASENVYSIRVSPGTL